MIIRRQEPGWLFVTQPAHAWMAGELAARWSNESFAQPEPREAVLAATRLHDVGWLEWDAAPPLKEDGRPRNFVEAPLSRTAPLWRRAAAQVALFNPYAGLLVSRHATTIFHGRLERATDPGAVQAELRALLDEHQAFRRALSRDLAGHPLYGTALDPEQIEGVYRWLRACDLFSLILLTDLGEKEGEIPDIPRAGWQDRITLRFRRRDPFTLHLDPSPFSQPLALDVPVRRLDQETFAGEAAYHRALASAPWETLSLRIE